MSANHQQSDLMKSRAFLDRYQEIDPTARSRFEMRPDAENFEGLKVIQHVKGGNGRRGSACLLLRVQAELFLERKRSELNKPAAPVAQSFDRRGLVQWMMDRGHTAAAHAIAKQKPRVRRSTSRV